MVPFTNAHWWLGLVFASIGIATGIAYYRSLYASLAGESSRGLKSGAHEAILFLGILAGSAGGGMLAHFWDIRAPYIPIAGLAFLVLIIQEVLPRANKTIDSRTVSKQNTELRGGPPGWWNWQTRMVEGHVLL